MRISFSSFYSSYSSTSPIPLCPSSSNSPPLPPARVISYVSELLISARSSTYLSLSLSLSLLAPLRSISLLWALTWGLLLPIFLQRKWALPVNKSTICTHACVPVCVRIMCFVCVCVCVCAGQTSQRSRCVSKSPPPLSLSRCCCSLHYLTSL